MVTPIAKLISVGLNKKQIQVGTIKRAMSFAPFSCSAIRLINCIYYNNNTQQLMA